MLSLAIPYLLKRPFRTVVTSRPKIDWSKVIFAGLLWLGITCLLELVLYFLSPEHYHLSFELQKFLPLLAISLLLIPLQTSFEEIFFRGYLLQSIGLVSRYKWIPLLITSLLFGLLHMANPEVSKFGVEIMAMYYICTGLGMGICTMMDDGLEITLGMHAVNNLFACLILTFDGSVLATPAIFTTEIANPQIMLVGWLLGLGIYIAVLSKKYHWKNWKKLVERFS